MRNFLFYMSCPKGKCETEIFGNNRLYDVAINDYTETNINPEEAEYKFSVNKFKYKHIKEDLGEICFNYKVVAIFDDDIRVSTNDLNRLFLVGDSLNFNIWQAALTKDSYSSWPHLYVKDNSYVRNTNKIELMMPFFSKSALQICWDTFSLTDSAWGAEDVWGVRLKYDKIMVVDAIPAKHVRPISSAGRKMPNGSTPDEEYLIMKKHFGINTPKKIY